MTVLRVTVYIIAAERNQLKIACSLGLVFATTMMNVCLFVIYSRTFSFGYSRRRSGWGYRRLPGYQRPVAPPFASALAAWSRWTSPRRPRCLLPTFRSRQCLARRRTSAHLQKVAELCNLQTTDSHLILWRRDSASRVYCRRAHEALRRNDFESLVATFWCWQKSAGRWRHRRQWLRAHPCSMSQ